MTQSLPTIALIGNPNCGKTALFNRLTHQHQKLGNWPGVTVEKKEGTLHTPHQSFTVIDLPGCYGFDMQTYHQAEDEAVPIQFLHRERPDWIINIIDAMHLQRHLYLTLQVLEANIPTIVVINMIDQAQHSGLIFDIERMTQWLGCPVLTLSAKYGTGLPALIKILQNHNPTCPTPPALPDFMQPYVSDLMVHLKEHSPNPYWSALRCLEQPTQHPWRSDTHLQTQVQTMHDTLQKSLHEDLDMLQAEHRYQAIEYWLPKIRNTTPSRHRAITTKLDRWLLNRWLGLPCFLGLMYTMFYLCIGISQYVQAPLDALTTLWFKQAPAVLLRYWHVPIPWIHIYQQSVGTALTTTLGFVPILLTLFFLLHFLEHSGYMSRAAFVMDKIMGLLKLPGRAFVSLLIGFGCNVPAMLSTRTLSNPQDKIITAMMIPFMSCSARLAVYAIFVQAFFPTSGEHVIFLLYCLGIGVAMLTGMILRLCCFPYPREPLTLELPRYQMPSLTIACQDSFRRLWGFMRRTFTFMLPACSILAILANTPGLGPQPAPTLLAQLAQSLTPFLSAIGIEQHNWPATVALILGTVAKEVMIGVLHTLYHPVHTHTFKTMAAILDQSHHVFTHWWHHVTSARQHQMSIAHHEAMGLKKHFGQDHQAMSYLIFTCLYVPCFSTIAALQKEHTRMWALVSILWSLIIACICAMSYQMITQKTWLSSLQMVFLGSMVSVVVGTLWWLHKRHRRHNGGVDIP